VVVEGERRTWLALRLAGRVVAQSHSVFGVEEEVAESEGVDSGAYDLVGL